MIAATDTGGTAAFGTREAGDPLLASKRLRAVESCSSFFERDKDFCVTDALSDYHSHELVML